MLAWLRAELARLSASPYLRAGVLLAVCALSLYLAVQDVALTEIGEALAQADLRYIGLALASVSLNNLAKAARWKLLLGPTGKHVPMSTLLASHLAGQTLNLFYPARLGDLSRAYIVGGMGLGRVFVLGSVVMEKLVDMLAYAALFIFLLLLIPLPNWIGDSAYGLAVITLGLWGFLLAASRKRLGLISALDWAARWMPVTLREQVIRRMRSGLESLAVLQGSRDLTRLAGWSALIWATAVLNNYLVIEALHLHLPLTASLLIAIALQVGISIPVPGRIGVFEYICVQSLALFDIEAAVGLSYGILLHGLTMFPLVAVGLGCLWLLGLARRRGEGMSAEEG